ncbi:MAG: 3'(2'),5'-bisphosphate nucleotidase CysQ [Bdellovibrionota bacterium]
MIDEIRTMAEAAGREILAYYRRGDWTVTNKVDDSPLTQADLAANQIITSGLAKISKDPVISEESDLRSFGDSTRFWLVDPLDGTRDFVAKLDTFAVLIALIENSKPVLGLIHSPVTGETWWAMKGKGAFGPTGARIHNSRTNRDELFAAGSRSMPSERMQQFLDHFKVKEVDRFGSALKFCKVAQGDFDLYPRFGPTNEWDTAAGQIICEESGCKVIDISTQVPITYGKPGFLNKGFIASRQDLDIAPELHRLGMLGPSKPSK